MDRRFALAFFVPLVGVLLYTSRADARGNKYACETMLTLEERAHDECGAILDLHVDLDYVPHPGDVVVPGANRRPITYAPVAPTTFVGGGLGAGVLFAGHFGLRFFEVDGGVSTEPTYRSSATGRVERTGAFVGSADVLGLILHGREETRAGYLSYQASLSPNLAIVDAFHTATATSDEGGTWGNYFFGARANGQVCYGRMFRACVFVSVNVYQFGHVMNGGSAGLSLPFVW